MEHWINLAWPVDSLQMAKIWNFHEVMGDAIIFHFSINTDVTDWALRGEIYDLNTSIRLANELGGSRSAPEIVVTDTVNGVFTVTCHTGLTATMQQYAQVEFAGWDASGNKFTIMQQPIRFTFERIIWTSENEPVFEQDDEDDGEDPLF